MISELLVNNIGGIREVSLHLKGRFIAITGESGSGKSSLVRALELVSGKRAQAALIRAGVEEGEVRAVLEMDGPVACLPDDLQPQEGFMVVKRIVSSTGRARSYLQERPVPLNTLTAALSKVIAIQSQFSQLELLEPGLQMELLDNSGGNQLRGSRSELSKKFSLALEHERKLLEISRKRKDIESRYQDGETFLSRFSKMELRPGCESEWEIEMNRIAERLEKHNRLRLSLDRMSGGSSGEGLSSSIENFCQDIRPILENYPETEKILEKVLSSVQELEAFLRSIASDQSEQSIQEEFEDLERRLGSLRKLMRYAKVDSVEDLIDFAAQTRSDLEWLRESRNIVSELQEGSAKLKREVSSLALCLREQRRAAGTELERSVNATLQDLAMEGLSFGISLKPMEKVRHSGADEITFFLSDNKHLKGPVSKIASGGELSRILLALQAASPDELLPDILVFDEVEAGLGGRSAVLAGQTLKKLSLRCQVIMITHEASIAALADQHFKVERDGENSRVVEIDRDLRVREIARMLAGDPDDPEAEGLARSLLENSQSPGL
jgi:DNA repair protein RecN (Recombination protein N)